MITVHRIDGATGNQPVVLLSDSPTSTWVAAFSAYIGTASMMQSKFVIHDRRIEVKLLPTGVTYDDVRGFLNQAISHANDAPSTR